MCELHEITKHTSELLVPIRIIAWTSFVITIGLVATALITEPRYLFVSHAEATNALWITLILFISYFVAFYSKQHYTNYLNKVSKE